MNDRKIPVTLFVLLCSAILVIGATCLRRDPGPDPLIPIVSEPDKLPYTRANLVYAGASVPVEMARSEAGNLVTFKLVSHDEVLEREVYLVDGVSFALREIVSMEIEPAIPLVSMIADKSDVQTKWSGRVVIDDRKYLAYAHLSFLKEDLNLPGGPYAADRVQVQLSIHIPASSDGPASVLDRNLSFWFVEGKGIIRRQAHTTSTREPADP